MKTTLVDIDSRYRLDKSNDEYHSGNFIIRIPSSINNVVAARVVSVILPPFLYQVTPIACNLFFESTIGSQFGIQCSYGKYSASDLAAHITTLLQTTDPNLSCSFDPVSLKIKFDSTGGTFKLLFHFSRADINLVSLLGYRSITYSGQTNYVADVPYHGLSKVDSAYLACPELGFTNQFLSTCPGLEHNIIAKIPLGYNEGNSTPLSYQPNSPQIPIFRYRTPQTIKQLTFNIVGLREDLQGHSEGWYVLDFNGFDVSFIIEFTHNFSHFFQNCLLLIHRYSVLLKYPHKFPVQVY